MAEEQWSTLDGTWHHSVATKRSQFHRARDDNHTISVCKDGYFLNTDIETWTRDEAIKSGRACKRCLKVGAIRGSSA